VNTDRAGITAGPTMKDQAGLALGQASLTVGEQATMLATLANGGVYHNAHVITSITQNNAPPTPIKITSYPVFSSDPTQNTNMASQVQYAMFQGRRVLRHRTGDRDEQRPGDHRQDPGPRTRPSRRSSSALSRTRPWPSRSSPTSRATAGRPCTTSAATARAVSAAPGRPRSGTPTPRTCSSRWASSRSPTPVFTGQTWNQVPPGLRQVPKKHKKHDPNGNGDQNGRGGRGGGQGGFPTPWPTFSCDPTAVTCQTGGTGPGGGRRPGRGAAARWARPWAPS